MKMSRIVFVVSPLTKKKKHTHRQFVFVHIVFVVLFLLTSPLSYEPTAQPYPILAECAIFLHFMPLKFTEKKKKKKRKKIYMKNGIANEK